MRPEIFRQILRMSSGCNLNQILLGISRRTVGIASNTTRHQNIEAFSTAATTEKWDLYSAVCLERHPIITPPKQEIEAKFSNLLKKIEFENSLKSDYELKVEREEKQKQSKSTDNLDKSEIITQTLQDIEDSYQEELNAFKFAPTVTKFDKQNITSSVLRKLDKCLLLLVQQKVGDTYFWIPPQGIRQEGETMRQTAERVLQDACGNKIKVKFYGNAPIGFYKYKYPKKLCTEGRYGAKVFYFLAKYERGNITNNVKYQWLDHEELEKALPNGVKKSISQFMLFS